ncbi:DUF2264 domain-containing protein [Bradyrhizobium arachidis]|uniref:DUF2264 domain-containing protein n=1 Tax=Bradyrhizobium arachidis TaxID=858423 RepID=A0AAE7NL56_9BRAD|nr:DUF2264 domain-containing protein [Bradyrhizobium arachidis]
MRIKLVLGCLTLVLALPIAFMKTGQPIDGWLKYRSMPPPGLQERDIQAAFADGSLSPKQRFVQLIKYFSDGFFRHATPNFERVNYPGIGGGAGFSVNGIEGFARTAVLLAAWARATRSEAERSEERLRIISALKSGILTGTDPQSPYFWGQIGDNDQRVVEGADVARVLYLTRDELWEKLSPLQQNQVAEWLEAGIFVDTLHNNWLLFPVAINNVLKSLGRGTERSDAAAFAKYQDFKSNYLENGWFFDKPEGVDYYNAWGITYEFFWLNRLSPDFDSDFIRNALTQSAALTSHLIGPSGIPIMGRSVCYRTAIPVPLIAVSLLENTSQSRGMALRALDLVWQHFISHDALRDGGLTQGYFDNDARFVDVYTGTGSCHWGLRSLALALLHNDPDSFWKSKEQPMPIELGSFHIELPRLGWILNGNHSTGEITIEILSNTKVNPPCADYGLSRRLAELVSRRPRRPNNHAAQYEARMYSTARPYPLRACNSWL